MNPRVKKVKKGSWHVHFDLFNFERVKSIRINSFDTVPLPRIGDIIKFDHEGFSHAHRVLNVWINYEEKTVSVQFDNEKFNY